MATTTLSKDDILEAIGRMSVVELAELILSAFKDLDQIRFVSSGTEAVMTAVRLARGATGRAKIVKCAGCYHGHADYLLVKAGSGLATAGQPDSAGVPAAIRHQAAMTSTSQAALRARGDSRRAKTDVESGRRMGSCSGGVAPYTGR